MEKKELMKKVESQMDSILRNEGFLKYKSFYYRPLLNRFLGAIAFSRSHFNSLTEFYMTALVHVKNVNTAYISDWLKKKTNCEYVYGGDILISNIGYITPSKRFLQSSFSINALDNEKKLKEMMDVIVPACNSFFHDIDSPDKFISYLMENPVMERDSEIMLLYYCCNRKDLALKYLEMIRQGRIRVVTKNDTLFRDFCQMFETLLPEDPNELLCEVPSYCRKRKIIFCD